ncbi:ergothioneine biosynthesis protein EgtB [Massilia solisilvae]|uniref:Ergothioneine biosynthesis protein EgtB n=1 Tax=Massilia solisilvae TaxID=1811225 RepID=A0ABT2BKI7_9BURK|nr:ergothioneine biosynthesis protein EgtB [Massilia solisilvae]MCS0609023.1 ergothioneine biosynthesis protein EgtB [Massilia solisilvae]
MDNELLRHYESVRQRSLRLAEPLSAEDCCAQSMPDASPVKWHLAHTTWFFETFVLEPHEPGFAPFDPSFRYLFNSYYNGIGARHPRPQRGLLTRPPLAQVLAWRGQVDERIAALAASTGDALHDLLTLGLHHEQQHQELMLTDVKHLLAQHPAAPAYLGRGLPAAPPSAPLGWQRFDGGLVEVGYEGIGFCFDNELPRHRAWVEPFELATRLVSNAEYARFVEQGGYRDPALWLSDGWDRVAAGELAHPLYWQRDGNGGWREFTLQGLAPLDPHRPVTHLSLYEADAYARWCGARLPTEAEWELAARGQAVEEGSLHPSSAPRFGLSQLFGACWQWTSSSYAPYPGYRPRDGALGEYNGKFMVNQYVLRGSSCATPAGHARASYRNFFPAGARWQFTGIRLAR